ncbi:response regulator transcription factor [Bdellovibrio sp. HCB274]|uniref:response regulator transcription factor n=1 Tax=Bdellovibrio sp. HCB274 TaxID=3394361 RepID=UPI0039B3F755
MAAKIFLLEDDPILGKAIQIQLELEQFDVHWAQTLSSGREIFKTQPGIDLFLLDVNLPDGNGYEFCEWLRSEGITSPIMFLTARTDEESVVRGFEHGANDYIRKPFGQKEIMARIKNQLSERKPVLDILRFAGLALIKNQQVLKTEEGLVTLNRREFEILRVFFENPETIISREKLISSLSSGEELFDRTVDSHISHIRSKLSKNGIANVKINSVYGQGYRLEKTP